MRRYYNLGVDMHLGGSAAMPGGEQNATATALVLDVFERVHKVGNAAETDEAAETEGPGVCAVSNFIADIRHGALAASRAICRRWAPRQTRNRRRALIHST